MRMVTLENMDEKIKKLDEFNGLFKEFETVLKEFEGWLGSGRYFWIVLSYVTWLSDTLG